MDELLTRRCLLRSASLALGLPLIEGVIGAEHGCASHVIHQLELTARDRPAAVFAAQASFWIAIYRLLQATAALVTILQYLQLRAAYASGVDYQDAAVCHDHMQIVEATMRQEGMGLFTEVARSPLDRDVTILAAQSAPGPGLLKAQLATQYRALEPVTLRDREVSLLHVAANFAITRWGLKGEALARFLAITKREEKHIPYLGTQPERVALFYNQAGGYVAYNPRRLGLATAGTLKIYLQPWTDEFNAPVVALVA